jgi:hypothetical protein
VRFSTFGIDPIWWLSFITRGLDSEKAAKIANMAQAANERLLKLTAWPTELIRLGLGSGAVVGFTMPKVIGHKQAFNLYSPRLRLQEFPRASWQFLIRSAANAARAFAVIHESGHVIGDVNHGNLFVGDRATGVITKSRRSRLLDTISVSMSVSGPNIGIKPRQFASIFKSKNSVRTNIYD